MRKLLSATLGAALALTATAAHAGPWTILFGFADARDGTQVRVLPDGRVLVIGGNDGAGHPAAHTSVFDPSTGAVTEVGTGAGGTAVAQRADGTVVISGGFVGFNPLMAAWQFLPTATAFASIGTPLSKQDGGTMVVLDADRLLSIGGYSSGSTEIYSYTSGAWTAGPATVYDRTNGASVRLNDGTVLAISGANGTVAERYRTASGTFTATAGALNVSRPNGSTLTLLTSGKVLVIGGSAQCELFDPTTDKFTLTGSMSVSRTNHMAVRLNDGRVLVAGGSGTNSSEIYDPTTGTFSSAGNTVLARSAAGGALMKDGRVVMAGGNVKGVLDSTAEAWGLLNGAACTANNDCVSAHCTDGVCCSVASCGAGLSCGIPPALGVCTKTLGSSCTTDTECATGHCADGVCCQTTCTGLCASCALPGKAGTCSAVTGDPLASHGTCPGATGTACGPHCNGSSTTACSLPGSTTSCGAASCSAGVATAAGSCNGAGACVAATTDCGNYACGVDGKTCNTTCTKSSDCRSGFACSGGACVAPADLGKPCTTGAACSTGFCADGVCCATDGCGADGSCSAGVTPGVCVKKQGVKCADDAQCGKGADGKGHCIDGVCCDTACDGQCQACDVEGYVGACTGVVGPPHGTRPVCDDGSDKCAHKICKGADDPTKCTGFENGPTVPCAKAHCDAGKEVAQSFCDGAGACVAPAASSCGSYKCDDATGTCTTTCTSGADCAAGFVCRAGRCDAGGAECSTDGLKSVGADGTSKDCAPYRCGADGTCASTCDTTDQCAPGITCDTASHQCVNAATGGGSDSGGCAFDARDSNVRGGALLFSLIAMCGLIRRRAAWRSR